MPVPRDEAVSGGAGTGTRSGTGITVWMSRNNVIMHNHTVGTAGDGIGMMGYYWQDPDTADEYYYAMSSGNTIRSNIVEGQLWVDLFEAYWDFGENLLLNPDGICRNSWEKNQFGTQIGVPGCLGAPVVLDVKDVCALDQDDH